MDELQIVYTTEAMQDILGISDYYFDKVGESAALRAVDALQNHIDKLMRFPRMGEEHPDEYLKALNFRKLVHDNHIVIYRVDTETVIIERIVWASSNYPELFQQGVPTLLALNRMVRISSASNSSGGCTVILQRFARRWPFSVEMASFNPCRILSYTPVLIVIAPFRILFSKTAPTVQSIFGWHCVQLQTNYPFHF